MEDDLRHSVSQLIQTLQTWLGATTVQLVVIAVVLALTLLVQRFVVRAIRKAFQDTSLGTTSMVINAVRACIWFASMAFVADVVFDVELAGVFTALGVGSLVLSLGLQDMIKNAAAGATIISERRLKVGDQIVMGEHRGEVVDVTWRVTLIRDIDGDLRSIPNSLFNTSVVVLRADDIAYRHEMTVQVRPDLDLDEVAETFERVLRETLEEHSFKAEGLDPVVRFLGATAYGIDTSVRLFIDDIEHRTPAFDAAMRALAKTGYLSDCNNPALPEGDSASA